MCIRVYIRFRRWVYTGKNVVQITKKRENMEESGHLGHYEKNVFRDTQNQ